MRRDWTVFYLVILIIICLECAANKPESLVCRFSIQFCIYFFWLLIDRSITKNSVPCVEIRFDYLLLLVVVVQYTIMLPSGWDFLGACPLLLPPTTPPYLLPLFLKASTSSSSFL